MNSVAQASRRRVYRASRPAMVQAARRRWNSQPGTAALQASWPGFAHIGVRHLFQSGLLAFLLSLTPLRAISAETGPTPAAPFLNLRDQTLRYSGPEETQTNLTEVRIGWFGPHELTNDLSGDQWWAASLAVSEANAGGGCQGLPFRLVPRWASDPWSAGVAKLARMIYDEKPVALLGSIDSASTHLAEQVVAKANLPLISPITTDKSVTLAGVSWMFSCCPSDDVMARVLVPEILAGPGAPGRKLALLACTDHESRMTTRELLREFSRRGRFPDHRFEASPGCADLGPQMEALKRAQAATVLIVAGAEDAARMVQAVRARLNDAVIYGTQSFGRFRFRHLAGQAAEGVRYPLLFVPKAADDVTARFISQFTRERGHEPDYAAAMTYDATRILLETIRATDPSAARVRENLSSRPPWMGVAGAIHFNGTGQNTRTNLWLATIRHGAVVLLTSQPGSKQAVQTTSNR